MHPCIYASVVAPCDEVFPVATCIKSLDAILNYGCVHSKSDTAVKMGRVLRQLCDEGAHIINNITFKTCSSVALVFMVGGSLARTSATGKLSWAKLQEAHVFALKSSLDVLTTLQWVALKMNGETAIFVTALDLVWKQLRKGREAAVFE